MRQFVPNFPTPRDALAAAIETQIGERSFGCQATPEVDTKSTQTDGVYDSVLEQFRVMSSSDKVVCTGIVSDRFTDYFTDTLS